MNCKLIGEKIKEIFIVSDILILELSRIAQPINCLVCVVIVVIQEGLLREKCLDCFL